MLHMSNSEFEDYKDQIKEELLEFFPQDNGKVKITNTGLVYYDVAGILYLVEEENYGWYLGSIFTLLTQGELNTNYDRIIESLGEDYDNIEDLWLTITEDGILVFDDGLTWLVQRSIWGNDWSIGDRIHNF